jgi:2-dehydropantoate 2-reductase
VTVAVLGVGAVGAMVAARLAASGQTVTCVARPGTADALRRSGITLETPGGMIHTTPAVVEQLVDRVTSLVVAVKAPQLDDALARVEAFAVADGVVLPLLNGLEHPDAIRRRLGPRVAPGAVSRFNGELVGPGHVRQRSARALVTAAPGDVTRDDLDRALEPLRAAGLDVTVVDDERAVLWGKAARLGPLAAATSASGLPVGALRADPVWRDRLGKAIDEACRVAVAEGVDADPAGHWVIIDGMPPDATTSTALDVAAGRPSELDAIAGSVLRAARRHGITCPVLTGLVEEARRP